jgi:hypothetical protein
VALAAIERGGLKIWFVHITMSEAAAVSDVDRRTRLLLALTDLGRRVHTYGLVTDESR